MPRNFPTVARLSPLGLVVERPTVTWAPLTAMTRPSISWPASLAREAAGEGLGDSGFKSAISIL
jgi:hypothetical protein